MRDRIRIRGRVTATVLEFTETGRIKWEKAMEAVIPEDEKKALIHRICSMDTRIKRNDPNWFQKILGLAGSPIVSVNNNIVTDEGDALIADLLAESPAKKKLTNTDGHIIVGTGWTGSSPKANTGLNTQVGTPQDLAATYPKLEGSFGNANDNVIQFRSVIAAGQTTSDGLDEAGLINNSATDVFDLLAYAEISASVNKGAADSLQIDWEITFTGS